MDDGERDDFQDALDEEERREGGASEEGLADEADEAVGEPNLPGEEVVMTSRGVGRAAPALRAPRPELERARREKRGVGEADLEVRDTGKEKRARQTTIDEMYAKEKLAEFTDAWLQWIYAKGSPFNAFRGLEFQRVWQAAERVPVSLRRGRRWRRWGDRETERCAAWWFDHGRAHPELRTIAIRVMHLWTSASPAERNWAAHERINTARRVKLGFAKLAQLVEIATNLKPASCARQGGGYVLPWAMGTGREGTAAEDEDEEGDGEPEVWGARPACSVPEQEIQRQIVAFHGGRLSRAHSVRDVFGKRATELRPWPEGGDDADAAAADDYVDDEWTNDDDTPLSGDPTAERVYFTYGGGRDGMDSFTSVITGGVPSTAQASGSSRAGGGRGGRSHAEVGVDDLGEQQPRGGLRQTGRRLGGGLGDFSVKGRRRASPSKVRTDADVVRGPVETEDERDARLDREEEEWLGSLPRWEGRFAYLDEQRRQRESETGGGGGRDDDDSGGGRRGDGETAGDEGQDVVMGGGSPRGGRGDGKTAGDEGQGAAVCGRGEGGSGGDGDTAGVGVDDGPDGDDDDDHGPKDDAYRLALVLRDPTVPPLLPKDSAHTFFDVDALAQALTDNPFAHMGRVSGNRRAPGRVYSPPPFEVQSPLWSGSSLSGVRGRESGAGEVGSDRRSDGGRDSAGSMPPPPARTPEAVVDFGDQTAAPGVPHSGGSPPTVRGGVGGGWSVVRRVGDQLRADYDTGRGVFSGCTPVQTQAGEGGSGRPSLQMAGRMLGLSRAEGHPRTCCGDSSTHRARRGC
ncbi:hypothetical protein CBR_g28015 [Chara braunii]|uniref:HAT C-terminal dimerisation domain-containing protein n=1 Tax=Chara braunii TaxID=69332 RepID=A0A388L982_CHABU|nr:hypothetical protein CBR_g28015 [Chara braunii]|eukprot:GBG78792.1 hypothetical protein CBR_g28015 [Chara braunii]